MELIKELNIDLNHNELITFVGAGGKTTTMFKLARELRNKGKSVLVTTTTAIYYPKNEKCDRIIVLENDSKIIFEESLVHGITVIGDRVTEEGKLKGIESGLVDRIYSKMIFDFVLVEGDGAKGRPIKVPADYEPVIPRFSTNIVAVIGLDALGKRINEDNVHRVKQFCYITNKKVNDIITEEDIVLIACNENGVFKGAPEKSRKLLLLNKAKSIEDIEAAKRIKKVIKMNICNEKLNIDNVIIGEKEERN